MSTTNERDALVGQLRGSITTMVFAIVAYGAFFIFFRPTFKMPLPIEAAFLFVAIAQLLCGLYLWMTTPTPKMMELPARKHGKAEREAGMTPRARAFSTRTKTTSMLLEFAGLFGVLSLATGLLPVIITGGAVLLASLASLGWTWSSLPAKARTTLG